MTALKVGALARRTGLTIRTLHHYDQIGLLSPTRRTASGHRVYEAPAVARLQQIRSLQQLGFSLLEIGGLLENDRLSAREVLAMHVQRLREQIEERRLLVDRLDRVARRLDAGEEVSVECFLQSIEAMTMFDKYYTPEQLKQLEQRREQVGEQRIRDVQQEWSELYEKARIEMEKGTDPADEAVQELVRKSRALIEEFTGGDEGIHASLAGMWNREPSVREQWGPSPDVAEFLRRAGSVSG